MQAAEKQHTVKTEATVTGIGLHTGQEVRMTFKAAAPGSGIVFERVDLPGSPWVEALVANVTDTARGTTICREQARVSTIEHVLAALTACGIDNCAIAINGPECPIMDGSSLPFIEAIEKAGIITQEAPRIYFEPKENIHFLDEETDTDYVLIPSDRPRYTAMVDYNSRVLVPQHAHLGSLDRFKDEIAPCRTFCFLHELEFMLDKGLIKGGTMNNALVFVEKVPEHGDLDRLAKLFGQPRIEVTREGTLNNVTMHHANEPARHKLLDLVGDMTLLGMRVRGHVYGTKPGHGGNVRFVKHLDQLLRKDKKAPGPGVDINAPALIDINGIMARLPHRPPFLLVDKILAMTESSVVGLKNVTMNEPFFVGHFPGEPVMPGVLQIEAMAQCGGILVMNTVPDPENYLTFFMKIDGVKFRKMVRPGDTLVFRLQLVSPIRRGICHMRGEAFVGSDVVMEAEMMAQIARKEPKNG